MPPVRTDHAADAELIERTRRGDSTAYGELWQRHAASGKTVARSFSSLDPDDLVAESFTRIYDAILAGKGPTAAFRPYLFTTIRNTAASWGRARHETNLETLESFEDPETSEAATLDALDRSTTAQAFRSLPTRWQEVLWYSEVEGMTPQQIAPLVGMSANSTAALAYRAREGLRQAWIQAHLKNATEPECRWTIDRLGTYTRGKLRARDTAKLEAHLDDCARCTIVAAEAREVGSRLALVLLPLAAGIGGATAYSAWLSQGVPVTNVAMGAGGMGAVGTAGAATSTAGASGTAGASSAGASGAGGTAAGTGAAGTGVGTGIAIGTGVLVLAAAAVAAAVIVPSLVPTDAPVAAPANEALAEAPASDPVEAPVPAAPPAEKPADDPVADPVPAPDVPSPSAPPPAASESPAPSPTPAPSPAPTPTPTPSPTPTPEPTPTPTPTPVDTEALPPEVFEPDTGGGLVEPVVSGTAEPGASITVSDGAATGGFAMAASTTSGWQTTADADGAWSLTLDGVPAGDSVFRAVQVDVAGNRSEATEFAVHLAAPPRLKLFVWRGVVWRIDVTDGSAGVDAELVVDGTTWHSFELDRRGSARFWLAEDLADLQTMTVRHRVGERVGPVGQPVFSGDEPVTAAPSAG